MITIEVEKASFDEKSGTTKNGKPYSIREQECYAHVLDRDTGKARKYPVKTRVMLDKDAAPYQPGMYTIDPASVQVGDFDALSFQRIRLVRVQAQK